MTHHDKESVDILGTQAHALEGWEERAKDLAVSELFKVTINPNAYLLDKLSEDEKKRLFKKLRLVQNAARYMAAGMVKGTIKYATDKYPLSQWFAHLIGEGADQMNYQMLLFQAWYAEQDKQEVEIAEVELEPVKGTLAEQLQDQVEEFRTAESAGAAPEGIKALEGDKIDASPERTHERLIGSPRPQGLAPDEGKGSQ